MSARYEKMYRKVAKDFLWKSVDELKKWLTRTKSWNQPIINFEWKFYKIVDIFNKLKKTWYKQQKLDTNVDSNLENDKEIKDS